jgi:hypothetical protein
MSLDELRDKIKPDIASIFGGSMADLILNKAKMKATADAGAADDAGRCKLFIDHLRTDEKLIGMWGELELAERAERWRGLPR